MKRSFFIAVALITALALYGCATCPVPPSAPRTYSLNTSQGQEARK
ncbi:MAG TPA: hypothetical protein PKJ17_09050 [Syntrophorhabdaceae bacterium]|nr:hypothetical protein [Syntrophorhabdaceae bacterium]